jgi:alanine-glyoxylate transaminase / serine-glyoxylate transaminase / serine-pyruvate transaminase
MTERPFRLLLGPGPSLVSSRVREAMARPLLGHLDPDFVQLMQETMRMLREVFRTKNPLTIPLSGTGTAGMEAAVANLLEPGDSFLVGVNGYFGERLVEMGKRQGAEVSTVSVPWGEPILPDQIEEALKKKPARVVAVVHAETSTGARSPVEEIAPIVHRHGALLIVDCVTSLGGLPLPIDELPVDAAFSGSQKCLSCSPGLAPFTINAAALERVRSRKQPVRSWYLDVSLLSGYWTEGADRVYHHTAPISMVYGLHESLKELLEEGLAARIARHRDVAAQLMKGLKGMGLEVLGRDAYRLPMLTPVKVPDGVNDADLRKRLLREHNIEVGAGLGPLKGKIFRVGLMGESARPENVDRLLRALGEILGRRP